MLDIEQLSLDSYERTIVISNIHGDLNMLTQLLENVSFSIARQLDSAYMQLK